MSLPIFYTLFTKTYEDVDLSKPYKKFAVDEEFFLKISETNKKVIEVTCLKNLNL